MKMRMGMRVEMVMEKEMKIKMKLSTEMKNNTMNALCLITAVQQADVSFVLS